MSLEPIDSAKIERDLSKSVDRSLSRSVDPDSSPPPNDKYKMNISPLGSLGTGGSMSSFATNNSRPKSGVEAKRRPWEQKETVRCMFCRGAKCKRCGKDAYRLCDDSPIKKIHANWITDDILAMQRPSDDHFVRHKFVEQLKDLNIVAVFNLQEPGEHPFCGYGIKESGFSYYPEKLMAAGIKFFNYSWKDMTTPPIAMMMDIVRIALNEINNGGKVAVHCHAGFGRTGIVIASIMMAQHRYEAEHTINIIRAKRPGSVQTTQQQVFVYEFRSAYKQMEEFFPPCTLGGDGPCLDKNGLASLKTIKVSENDQHYCLSPDEAVKYAICPKPVALAIDLLQTASVLSAALTACFIIGLHPNLVVKAESFNPSAPLFMPPLEPEILLPKHGSQVNIPRTVVASSVDTTAQQEKKAEAPTKGMPSVAEETDVNRYSSSSLNTGSTGLGTGNRPPRSSKAKTHVVKSHRDHLLAYRVARAKHAISTHDWISEDTIDLFKVDANLGNWDRWVPPQSTFDRARSTPVQAARQNMGIAKLSESIEIIQKTPRVSSSSVTPRIDAASPAKPSSPYVSGTPTKLLLEKILSDPDPDETDCPSPEFSATDKVMSPAAQLAHKSTNVNSSLPPLNFSPTAKAPESHSSNKRRLSHDSYPFGGSFNTLPKLVESSPMKPADSASALPLLSAAKPGEMIMRGKSKSFSSFNEFNDSMNVHVRPQVTVGDDHISEAIVKEELEAREKLLSLKNSVKRRNSKTELLLETDSGDRPDTFRRKSSLGDMRDLRQQSESKLNTSASGYLEIVQALGDKNANGKSLEHESHFFLGGILLVDWLESRADPLIDDSVLEMLSDAWCKSMSTKQSTDSSDSSRKSPNSASDTFQSTPCEPVGETTESHSPQPPPVKLAAQGKSTSFLGGIASSFSPDRPKGGKHSSKNKKLPPKLGRGSTYASFGVEGEPVTGKILDDLLKQHMPKHKLKTLQYIVTAVTALYRASVDTVVDKELTRCAIMRIAIACTLVARRCSVLVVGRTMNPLLMTAVRNAKIQASITRDNDLEKAQLDPSGFPLSVIHDIKVVVETFRLLIRGDWMYSTDKQQKVHWDERRLAELSPSLTGSTSQEEPSPDDQSSKDSESKGKRKG